MTKAILALGLLSLALACPAADLVTNGAFDSGLAGWQASGSAALHAVGDFGMPASPSGGAFAGVISSWGGDWAGPSGIISQSINFTGTGTLSGELFAASRGPDSWRDAATTVYWNGTIVANLQRNGDPAQWASDASWTSFSTPVTGIGTNELRVDFTVHYAEWTWVGADNIALQTNGADSRVPEMPASLLALVPSLALLLRRRK